MPVLKLIPILTFHFKWQFSLSIFLYIICTRNNVQSHTKSVTLLFGFCTICAWLPIRASYFFVLESLPLSCYIIIEVRLYEKYIFCYK